MTWRELFVDYLENPHAHWTENRQRQADKLQARIDAAGGRERAASTITSLAEQRAQDRPRTLFVTSCGSSGSHWLTAMLSALAGVVDCGEVYLPDAMLDEAGKLDDADRPSLIDCVHLAHAPALDQSLVRSCLINSAHRAGWGIAAALGPTATRVLLIRDPVDVVVSRTFRKPEYREAVAPGASDAEYLLQNITFVERFHERAARHDHDLVVRFDDMLSDAAAVLTQVCDTLGVYTNGIEDAARAGATTKRRGDHVEIPNDLRTQALDALAPLRARLGYA